MAKPKPTPCRARKGTFHLHTHAEVEYVMRAVELHDELVDAAAQALAYVGAQSRYEYQLSLVREKAEEKLRSVLAKLPASNR